MSARHCGEIRGAFQTYRDVTEVGKHLEVASGPAAEIEYRKPRLTLHVFQHRRDVLADVVIARAFPELFGTMVVMFQREISDFLQVLLVQFQLRYSNLMFEVTCVRGQTLIS
jgi:hypothetical protein